MQGERTVEQVTAEVAEVERRTARSLQESLRLAEESCAVGAHTLDRLRQQTEQIERARERLHETDAHLKASDKLLRQLGGVGGYIAGLFSSSSSSSKGSAGRRAMTPPAPSSSSSSAAPAPARTAPPRTTSTTVASSSSSSSSALSTRLRGGSARATTPPPTTTAPSVQALEQDLELDQIAEAVKKMKHLGHEIGDTLGQHNQMLEEMDSHIDHTHAHLRTTHGRAKSLL